MNKIASFKKVSFEEFKKDYFNLGYEWLADKDLMQIYQNIKLPIRKTTGSAGHDINMPFQVNLLPNTRRIIPTGIRCEMQDDYVMLVFPRSSFGIKKHMFISNTIPVVDSDYYYADNEGHIFMSIENRGLSELKIEQGESFCQALFIPYGVADTTTVDNTRTGGIGSTDKE